MNAHQRRLKNRRHAKHLIEKARVAAHAEENWRQIKAKGFNSMTDYLNHCIATTMPSRYEMIEAFYGKAR